MNRDSCTSFSAWLITTLVVLLIYLCTRCCDTKSTKHRKSRPIRCILSFFALVTAAGLAGGFYGNHVLHGGVIEFEKATNEINNIVRRVQDMSRQYNEDLQKHIEQNMNKLYDGPFQRDIQTGDIQNSRESHLKIMDNSNEIFKNITVGLEAMDDIRLTVNNPQKRYGKRDSNMRGKLLNYCFPLFRIDLRHVPYVAAHVERYRWPVTMALQGLFTLFCLLLFVGAIVHSRCVLILFSVCGLFSIIFLWLLASVYTTASVALADFCHDPTPWVMHIMQDKISKDISSYYLQCAIGRENPFERPIAVRFLRKHSFQNHLQNVSIFFYRNRREPLMILTPVSEKFPALPGSIIPNLNW